MLNKKRTCILMATVGVLVITFVQVYILIDNEKEHSIQIYLKENLKQKNETLREIGKDEVWLNTVLRQKMLALNDVFFAFYTYKKTFIITRSDLL